MNAKFGDLKWKTDNSIFQRLVKSIADSGKIDVSAFKLSGKASTEKDDDRLVFAPGLGDAMLPNDDKDQRKLDRNARKLSKLLKKISANGDEGIRHEFYTLIERNETLIGITDELLQFV